MIFASPRTLRKYCSTAVITVAYLKRCAERRKTLNLKRTVALLLCGVMLLTGTGITTLTIPANAVTAQATQTKWPSGPKKNSLSSDSAIVMELSTGTILYEKNSHKKHYPASITKILTSMLLAENTSMNETVTVSSTAAYGIETGSSTIFSEPGEKLSVEQCLNAIMLESANEVCLAVAEHISGSISNFVGLMNKRVKDLGLKDTHFNNPNGLPDPKHYTTAYDMAVIARQAMKSSAFRKACGTRRYVCAKTNKHKQERTWQNHHQMINGWRYPKYEYKYAIGGKTGYTHVAQNTLVTYGEKNGMELVCVIMKAAGPKQGEPNEYTDTTKLLNYGFEKYQKYTVNQENEQINADLFNNYGSYFNADESPVRLADGACVVLPKGIPLSAAKQSITYNKNVKLHDGDNVIGQITYTYGNKTVGASNIIYTNSDSTKHLDEASRNLVNAKIANMEANNSKHKIQKKLFRNIADAANQLSRKVGSVLHNQLLGSVIIIIIALLLIIIIAVLLRNLTPSHRRRGRKRSGGYQSRGGRRHHAKQKKNRSRGDFAPSSERRNHSKHYEKHTPRKENTKKRKKGVQYHKRHKRTKESFGKNFFDF